MSSSFFDSVTFSSYRSQALEALEASLRALVRDVVLSFDKRFEKNARDRKQWKPHEFNKRAAVTCAPQRRQPRRLVFKTN